MTSISRKLTTQSHFDNSIQSGTTSSSADSVRSRAPTTRNETDSGYSETSQSSVVYHRYQSRLIAPGNVPKPWLEDEKRRKKRFSWPKILPWTGVFVGFVALGLLVWDGYRQVNKHKYCLVFQDDFASPSLDFSKWSYDVQVGGYGNGQFEWTTDSPDNTFIEDRILHLRPTLTEKILTADQILDGYTLNLTLDGTCTSSDPYQCAVASNFTTKEIINPVRSSRIHTKGKGSIRYGRVEVVARMPKGEWLWPAIWMLPENNIYGPWPQSGEIDIVESRGNSDDYRVGGKNQISSALHWGPEADMDAFYKTTSYKKLQRGDYASNFHTFGLEWTPEYLATYVDSKLKHVQYTKFDQYFWQRGKFPAKNVNNTAVVDIWSQSGNYSTPFDQEFFLILNVAVGGRNGWFPDGEGEKPWVNQAVGAQRDFWNAQNEWYPTWSDNSSMQVKDVKMWQQSDGVQLL